MDKLVLVSELIESVKNLRLRDENELDRIKKRADMILSNIMPDREYSEQIHNINFWPMIYPTDTQYENECWESGKNGLLNLLSAIKEEVELFGTEKQNVSSENINRTKVFIVHGHDEEMKQSVARFIEKLDLEAIILHEQPDKGRNVLDKLIQESKNASFAVVLLSPDDVGYDKNNREEHLRARQNVVLELGYFIALLGKERVCALFKNSSDFELPSDFVGNLYKQYSGSDAWKIELAKELKVANVPIDMNKVL